MRHRLKGFSSSFSAVCVLGSFLLALAATGCGDDTPTSPDNPDDPVLVTETFSGTLTRNGAVTHDFDTSGPGEMSATITALSPDQNAIVGFAIGLWNGTVCDLSRGLIRDQASTTTVIYGSVNARGSLCVRIYDVGRLDNPTDYEITVTHP
jgi:hypothetical protein